MIWKILGLAVGVACIGINIPGTIEGTGTSTWACGWSSGITFMIFLRICSDFDAGDR